MRKMEVYTLVCALSRYQNSVFVLLLLASSCQSHGTKCRVKLDLEVCQSHAGEVQGSHCDEVIAPVCLKTINVTFIELEPYGHYVVDDLLRTCCCGKTNGTTHVSTVRKMSELTKTVLDHSDFVFPVLASFDAVEVYGFHFIPIVETSSVYYITLKANKLLQRSLLSCLRMWPLMLICILMVAVSGFIGWLMETRSNSKEFPRPFLIGWFDGFWWSFISMTTVGYGDKVPKSIMARLFSVFWICIGVTTFSLVTAILSSEFNKINTLVPPSMNGKYIGGIRYRLYEATYVADNGGILIDVESPTISDGIHDLIEMLKNENIDGFILDKYALLIFHREMQEVDLYSEDVTFLKTKTRRAEILHTDKRYSYGILVKSTEDYVFLGDFVRDNRIVLNTCNQLLINKFGKMEMPDDEPSPLLSISMSNKLFWTTFIIITSVLTIICSFGMVYEICRRRGKKGVGQGASTRGRISKHIKNSIYNSIN